jgi:division/cell wall cluster transcriptional repressor MraZ
MLNHFNEKSLHAIDGKGRLLLPKEVRDGLDIKQGDVLFLIPNLADPPYLEIRTAQQWERYRKSLRRESSGEQKKDTFRYAMMIKETAIVDGQGRFMIPNRIRETCHLDGTVAVVDMDIYVEVWCKAHMAKKYADMVRAFKETNDRMF